MIANEELDYNEHVIAHETYLLLKNFDEAKAERLQHVRSASIELPQDDVSLPEPEIMEESVSVTPVLRLDLSRIAHAISPSSPIKTADYQFSFNAEPFQDIQTPSAVIKPSQQVSVQIDPQIFSEVFSKTTVPGTARLELSPISPIDPGIQPVTSDLTPISFEAAAPDKMLQTESIAAALRINPSTAPTELRPNITLPTPAAPTAVKLPAPNAAFLFDPSAVTTMKEQVTLVHPTVSSGLTALKQKPSMPTLDLKPIAAPKELDASAFHIIIPGITDDKLLPQTTIPPTAGLASIRPVINPSLSLPSVRTTAAPKLSVPAMTAENPTLPAFQPTAAGKLSPPTITSDRPALPVFQPASPTVFSVVKPVPTVQKLPTFRSPAAPSFTGAVRVPAVAPAAAISVPETRVKLPVSAASRAKTTVPVPGLPKPVNTGSMKPVIQKKVPDLRTADLSPGTVSLPSVRLSPPSVTLPAIRDADPVSIPETVSAIKTANDVTLPSVTVHSREMLLQDFRSSLEEDLIHEE